MLDTIQVDPAEETSPEEIAAELAEYERQIGKFRRGEIGEIKMQKLRLHYGTYAQRQEGVQMQRIKIPGGVLNADQLDRLADAADRYASGFIHFTTREDAQLYYVKLEEVPALLRALAEVGVTTREACGNTVRNITACYRAGTSPTEAFDVAPYALALFRHLVRNKYNQVLGRKFKITFEGCAEDHSGLRIHDIGFQAGTREGERGFRVYVGGGLGGAPMLGHLYAEFLPEAELFSFATAILRLFDRYGERKARMKARMKFLIQTMGWESFRTALDEERQLVGVIPFAPPEEIVPPVVAPEPELRLLDPRAGGEGFQEWARDSVVAHKVAGLRGAHVRLKLGDIVSDRARKLAEVARRFSAGELRVSINQNLYLPWVREGDLPDLYAALGAIGLSDAGAETVTDITTCPGADTCRLGIASAKGLGSAISEAFRGGALAGYGELARDLKIKISGCPNGCAQHTVAHVGFHAAAQTQGGRTVPAHLLFLGGQAHGDRSEIGRVIGKYPARNGVKVMEALLGLYRREGEPGEEFNDCLARVGAGRLKELLEPLRAVPAFDEDPEFYQDFGHENERFAVRQGVQGECAGAPVAEAVPTIEEAEEQLYQGEAYFAHGEWEGAVLSGYEAAAAAARVPLYARLVDPFTSEQALWEFENVFVLAGQTGGAWREVSSRLDGLKAAEPTEAAAREMLDQARELVNYCRDFAKRPEQR